MDDSRLGVSLLAIALALALALAQLSVQVSTVAAALVGNLYHTMSFTPAHVAQARCAGTRQLPPQDLIRVRTMYVDKRYKHCISACEELLQPPPSTPVTPSFPASTASIELHPVHRAFLVFHQAIAYECLGLAAHKYSQNKLRFLESARQKFDAALNILPQPFANTEDGGQLFSNDSPDLRRIDDGVSYYEEDAQSVDTVVPVEHEQASKDALSMDMTKEGDVAGEQEQMHNIPSTPSKSPPRRARASSMESDGFTATSISALPRYATPNFDDYSPRQDFVGQPHQLTPDQTPSTAQSKGRLPRSTPLVDVTLSDGESSSDEDTSAEAHSSWLPRSMRSLNLAAYDLSSDESDGAYTTPSKRPALAEVAGNVSHRQTSQIAQTPLSMAMDGLSLPSTVNSTHANRLSASLSSTHQLCEDLVPCPLFKKTKKMIKVSFEADEVQPPRPLPPTPFSFHTHMSLLPTRKTAVQTLISRYEGTIPSPGSSYVTATPPASGRSQLTLRTPITPRFNMIREAFAPSPNHAHLRAYLTSRSLAHYNRQLTDFRTCLLTALAQVAKVHDVAEALQQRHDEDKRAAALRDNSVGLPKNRLASMWLLTTPGKPTTSKPCVPRGPQKQDVGSPSRSRMLARSESLRHRKKVPLRYRVEESKEKRAQRIKKLRDNGFKVNKERCGWKGEEYYEKFRRRVEIELACIKQRE